MRFSIERSHPPHISTMFAPLARGYDPELMMVECARCGRPVLWEPGRSTQVLEGVGIDPLEIDAHCLLMTDGCPYCRPRQVEGFNVQVFRLTPERNSAHNVKTADDA